MGKDNLEADFYGWDNEFGGEVFNVPDFEVSQKLASNAEYLEFVKAGAYEPHCRKYWTDEGWKYVQDCKVKGPRFWLTA